MPEPEYSSKQVGIIGQYEPELCAVSGRPVRGKHAVTHYKGDNVHYVRVLNQFDGRWPEAAPRYGFPVTEEKPAQDENVFVLEGINSDLAADYLLNQSVDSGEYGWATKQAAVIPGDTTPLNARPTKATSKASSASQSDIKADGMSKGDD